MKLDKDKAATMAFPLVAIGNVSVDKREYVHGDTFDAETESNRDFLLSHNAAVEGTDELTPAAAVIVSADVARTDAETTGRTDTLATSDAPSTEIGAKGTTDEQPAPNGGLPLNAGQPTRRGGRSGIAGIFGGDKPAKRK